MKQLFGNGSDMPQHNPIHLIGVKFLELYLIMGCLLRIIMMLNAPDNATFSFIEITRIIVFGFAGDVGMGLMLCMPLLIVYAGLNEWKYRRLPGLIIITLLTVGFIYVAFFHSVFDEYGGGAPIIAKIFLGWKVASFSIRLFIPVTRAAWRRCSLYFTWGLYVLLFLAVSTGEYFFWQEFGVRYNFIAVDYLVYTNEVIGNIMESYNIVPIIIILLLSTVAIMTWQSRNARMRISNLFAPKYSAIHITILLLATGWLFALTVFLHHLSSSNHYVEQLEQNGSFDFVFAFMHNKLDYDKFYPMMPERQCEASYSRLTGKQSCTCDSRIRPNIVLITVESLSAEFMSRYGNRENLTPNMDMLAERALTLDSLYAVGNRTVRGLEALSTCMPPSAGESVIKRKDNRMGMLSAGNIMRRHGYNVQFLYGGDSYFDNMKDYFSHNGYEVIDRGDISKSEISFANIWGVCDEDIFSKSLSVFEKDAETGKPFFAQIMTTSNHRPYTYPAGRVRVSESPESREGAVKYTDYAIGRFMQEASRKAWFRNTVFIIVADHCASSAGKTSIPIENYHVPCIIYCPQFIKPGKFTKTCSQIDILPTVFARFGLPELRGAGLDVLCPDYKPRAFMATYQNLGYMEKDVLTVLSPVRKQQQYNVNLQSDGTFEETLCLRRQKPLLLRAVTYYQYSNLYAHKINR